MKIELTKVLVDDKRVLKLKCLRKSLWMKNLRFLYEKFTRDENCL